jgi:hypothetical protein
LQKKRACRADDLAAHLATSRGSDDATTLPTADAADAPTPPPKADADAPTRQP